MSEQRHGRPLSWVTVAIFLAAFATGGVALTVGAWWLFWTCVGVVAASVVLALVVDVVSDVVLDPIHGDQGSPFVGRFGRTTSEAPERLEPRTFGHAPSVGSKEEVQRADDG